MSEWTSRKENFFDEFQQIFSAIQRNSWENLCNFYNGLLLVLSLKLFWQERESGHENSSFSFHYTTILLTRNLQAPSETALKCPSTCATLQLVHLKLDNQHVNATASECNVCGKEEEEENFELRNVTFQADSSIEATSRVFFQSSKYKS